MSSEFKYAKEAYDDIPIPEELSGRVVAGIRQGQANRRRAARVRSFRRTVGTFAACFAVLLAGLNLSPSMAAAAAEMPVLGELFQVLTLRDYTDVNDDRVVSVEQPALEGDGALAERVNREIQERVDAKIAEGERIVAEYKESFFTTGGTQAEWEQHDNRVNVSYAIKSRTDTTVSFVVDSYVSTTSAISEQVYYNLDLAAEKELTLADVLGEDWKTICNDAVQAQIAASENASQYFADSAVVDETTQFYLNEAGDPVVVFPKYAVAVGALGIVEFEITE